jgi:hypothetical protein
MGPGQAPADRPVPGPGGFSSRGTGATPGQGLLGSKLPDVPAVQPARYQDAGDSGKVPTPAELAGQTPAAAPKPW